MAENIIKAGVIYEHSNDGIVLVSSIGEMYDEYYVTDTGSNSNIKRSTFVYYHQDYDGYGGMLQPITQDVQEFADSVDRVREHDYAEVDIE